MKYLREIISLYSFQTTFITSEYPHYDKNITHASSFINIAFVNNHYAHNRV